MYTVEELKSNLYKHLVFSAGIRSKISGDVYKDRRPYDSTKEDVVINALPADNQFLQTGYLNVNCYVPYIQTVNLQEKVLNNKRIGEIAKLMLSELEDIWLNNMNTNVEYHSIIEESDVCYINFRIKAKAFLTN